MEDIFIKGEPIYYAHVLSPKFKELIIVPISDVHYGNPLFSPKHFQRTLDFISSKPNTFCILNGDLCESTIKTSKGEIFRQVGTPQDQRDWIIKKLLPIKDRILGVTMGNHELRIYNEVGIDICKDIAAALKAPYRPEGLLLKISFGGGNNRMQERPYIYFGYMTHGYGGARTKSAKAVKVERLGTWLHADFYIMSHDHVSNAAPDVYLMPDPHSRDEKDKEGNLTGFKIGSVIAHRKMLIKSSAFIKWGGYSEMGGFPPVDLENPVITLHGTGHPMVRVEI